MILMRTHMSLLLALLVGMNMLPDRAYARVSTQSNPAPGPRGALPLLNDGGSIILNGSVASVKGTGGFGVYAASKAAVRSFVRTWTTDLKDRRIRSNVVSPGPINTSLANRQSADVIARIVSTIPMGRMGEPEEVAKVALFLASEDSSFVTGIELFVDGGRAQI
jgi:NAD(P)-dependent dehydrogenase (short-subunit alcohol dehydrogenase family)